MSILTFFLCTLCFSLFLVSMSPLNKVDFPFPSFENRAVNDLG